MEPKRLCILGVFDEQYAQLAESSTNDNWCTYAHEYDYVVKGVKILWPELPTSWYKILHLRETLKSGRYDWVCYFDTDLLFTNFETPLESFFDDESFLIASDDVDELGEMIGAQLCFRHCQDSIDFLDLVWEQREKYLDHPWEQPAINEVAKLEQFKNKIRRWSGCLFHSFFPSSDVGRVTAYPSSTLMTWFPGCFTCHFTAAPLETRNNQMHGLNEWLKKQQTEIAEGS